MMVILDLVAKLRADMAEGQKQLAAFHKNLGDDTKGAAEKGTGGIAGFIAGALPIAAVAGAGILVTHALGDMVGKALEANKGIAQTAAVLASTHGVSGQTAQSISALADHLKDLDGVDDDVVRSASNMLLTFTNIQGDTFPAATQAALDMSAALGQDATQSAMQLGKALNDPVAGVSALQRVGVKLTETQKQNIADAMKHGDVAKAQGIILKELGTEFGGSAKAAGDAAGPMNKLSLMWGDMQKVIGNALLPVINKLANAAMPLVVSFGEWLPGALKAAQDAVTPVAAALSNLGPIIQGIGGVLAFLAQNGDMVKTVMGALAIAIGIVLVPAFVAWAVAAGIAAIATIAATWPIIAIIAGITLLIVGIKLLIDHWSEIAAWLGSVWASVTAGVQTGLQVMGQWFSHLGTIIQAALQAAIAQVIAFGVGLIVRFVEAKNQADRTIGDLVNNVVNFFASLPGRVIGFISTLVGGVVNWFVTMELRGLAVITGFIGSMISRFMGAIGQTNSAFGSIASAAVGALAGLGGRLAGMARDAISNMISAILGMAGRVGSAIGGLFSHFHLPGFASGGDVTESGLYKVGEDGEEVVALPAGAHVYSHGTGPTTGATASAMTPSASSRGSGGPTNVTLVLDDAGMRPIARMMLPILVNEMRISGVKLG